MKKLILTITILLAFLSSNAQEYTKDKFRSVPNNAYGFGEILEYNIGMKALTVGRGYLKISPEPVWIFGRKCYEVKFGATSTKTLELVFKVQDEFATYVDVDGIFPWKYTQKIREGHYKKDFWALMDQKRNIAITKESTYKIPAYVYDALSAFVSVRSMDLASKPNGSIIKLQNFWMDSTYKLDVRVVKRETVKVPAGKFKCIVVEPHLSGGGLFNSKDVVWIWLTDDDRKIPVKIGTKIIIGTVGAELTKYSGIRGEIKSKIE
jgi:hypothetical protein